MLGATRAEAQRQAQEQAWAQELGWLTAAWMEVPAVIQQRWSQAAAAVPAASCDAHSLLQLQDYESAQGLGRKGARCDCERVRERGRVGRGRGRDAGGGKKKAGQCQLELCGRPV